MEAVFLKILNMSITAGWIVLAVIVMRLLFKKAPKWITVLMWGLAGIRLIFPFSPESVFSLIPSAETVPAEILYTDTPKIHSGIPFLNNAVNPVVLASLTPAAGASVNPAQVVTFAASVIWLAGIAGMLVYMAVSSLSIHRRVREAVPLRENVLLCDRVDTPFLLGVIRPKIYLPSSMGGKDTEYVIAHEKAHLKRLDHIWKPLAFLLLAVYWFHPVFWIAYILLCRDIELACDEKVIREMGAENKKPYSEALINCSMPRRMIAACPLAFGETNVKGRVRSVLNYKKPAFWVIAAVVVLCGIAAVCFLTDPKTPAEDKRLRQTYPQYFDLDAANGLDVYVWQMAPDSYDFGLLPHSDIPRDAFDKDMLDLRGTSAEEMRHILSAYTVGKNDIYIIPWNVPFSSYIAYPWSIELEDGVNIEEVNDEKIFEEALEDYRKTIEKMLWGDGK